MSFDVSSKICQIRQFYTFFLKFTVFDVVILLYYFICWLSLTKSMETIVHRGLSKF